MYALDRLTDSNAPTVSVLHSAVVRYRCLGFAVAVACGPAQSPDATRPGVTERPNGRPPGTASVARAFNAPRRPYGDLRMQFTAAVAKAETEGARHPRAGGAASSVARRCVDATAPPPDVYGSGNFQSGEFTAGPFAMYAEIWRTGSGKLWWAPQHVDTSATFVLRAEPLDHTGEAYELRRHGLARGIGPGDAFYFYPTAARLPRPGVWLIVVSAGV
jgi:hypothetical protein